MGKRIESPVKRFPGYVILPDFDDWNILCKWGDFIGSLGENVFKNIKLEADFLPNFVKIDIENFPTDFTKKPPHFRDVGHVFDWIVGEISTVVYGDEITPFSEGASTNGSKE